MMGAGISIGTFSLPTASKLSFLAGELPILRFWIPEEAYKMCILAFRRQRYHDVGSGDGVIPALKA